MDVIARALFRGNLQRGDELPDGRLARQVAREEHTALWAGLQIRRLVGLGTANGEQQAALALANRPAYNGQELRVQRLHRELLAVGIITQAQGAQVETTAPPCETDEDEARERERPLLEKARAQIVKVVKRRDRPAAVALLPSMGAPTAAELNVWAGELVLRGWLPIDWARSRGIKATIEELRAPELLGA